MKNEKNRHEAALDADGQPLNTAFNRARNRNKAASTLMGILCGITADQKLNDTEVMFLKLWADGQDCKDGDILDIYDAVSAILEDNVVTSEERDDLFELLNDCIHFSKKTKEDDADVNMLIGLLKGITADGVINQSEFKALKHFVDEKKDLISTYPFDVICKRINEILSDGVVTDDELASLKELACDITGTDFTEDGDAVGGATTLFNDPIPDDLNGKSICFTGKFLSGQRKEIEKKAIAHGAIPQSGVSGKTDCVIIGTLVSRDWIHESSGRKIEKAVELKKQGKSIVISNEKMWNDKISSV